MAPPRILVADDDAWILRMVTTVLEKRGYIVDTATDGQEAYNRAIANVPDLVITDVMMPKMDGWTLIKALRARSEFTFVPVIFLTALGGDDDRIRGFRLGADDYMPKPFRFEELDLRVAKTMKRKEAVERSAREHIRTPPDGVPIVKKPGGMSTSLAGNLAEVGIPALLTLLEMESKSGILVVTHEDHDSGTTRDLAVGRVFLRRGSVLCARFDRHDIPINEDCIYRMMEWTVGRFEFNQTEVDMEDQIRTKTSHLLMEGARRIDERTTG